MLHKALFSVKVKFKNKIEGEWRVKKKCAAELFLKQNKLREME